jgi:hypothetical protein
MIHRSAHDAAILALVNESLKRRVMQVTGGTVVGQLVPVTTATKPADPAFVNALRPRKLRIGLRYLGD